MSFWKMLLTTAWEYIYQIVNFDTLIQDRRHDTGAIGWPFNVNRTVRFGLTNFLEIVQGPEIDLAFQVSKPSNECKLGKWTNSNRVTVTFPEFKQGLAVFVVQSCSRGLISRNDDKLLTRWNPCHILDNILENRHRLPISTSKDLNVLQTMQTIVALAWRVVQVLGPN